MIEEPPASTPSAVSSSASRYHGKLHARAGGGVGLIAGHGGVHGQALAVGFQVQLGLVGGRPIFR